MYDVQFALNTHNIVYSLYLPTNTHKGFPLKVLNVPSKVILLTARQSSFEREKKVSNY